MPRILFDGPHACWRWRSEFDVPNASVWWEPRWGFYLRTRRWRVTAGPLFGWRVGRVRD